MPYSAAMKTRYIFWNIENVIPYDRRREIAVVFMFAGDVDWYRISSIFKASECSVGFPYPTEKDEAEKNVGLGSPTLRDLMYI